MDLSLPAVISEGRTFIVIDISRSLALRQLRATSANLVQIDLRRPCLKRDLNRYCRPSYYQLHPSSLPPSSFRVISRI